MDDSISQADVPSTPALNVGDRIELTIDDMAFGGEGVGRIDGFVVFVPFVISGETVLVEITEKKKAFARAKPLQVLEASADRVEPRCEHFGTCGGCQYQHIDYNTQQTIKESQVRDLFERIGGFDSTVVGNLVPCPEPYNYRNRIMVRRQWNKIEQRPVYGFLHWDSRLVIDLQNCHIAESALNEQLQEVRENPPPRNMQKVVLRMMPDDWEMHRDSFFQNNFHLLPELVEIASWGSADVTEDDFALVRSHFVLIGGLILPHPAEGDPGATALLDINLLCKGIAADLRVPSEEVHCYRNGTVSASPPVIDPEAARDARAAEDYEATAAYEHVHTTESIG